MPDFLRSATVGLAPWPPSWDMQVNRPLKLTEYLCLGLPVVLTDITPHQIVPTDAPFAFWAGDGTPQAFADGVLEAHAAADTLPSLGRMAASWAAPRLGWSEQFATLEGAIDACMRPPAAHSDGACRHDPFGGVVCPSPERYRSTLETRSRPA